MADKNKFMKTEKAERINKEDTKRRAYTKPDVKVANIYERIALGCNKQAGSCFPPVESV